MRNAHIFWDLIVLVHGLENPIQFLVAGIGGCTYFLFVFGVDGHQDIIKRLFENGVERYVRNYLNFNVTDFNIEERGSLRDVDLRVREQYELNDGANNDGDLL